MVLVNITCKRKTLKAIPCIAGETIGMNADRGSREHCWLAIGQIEKSLTVHQTIQGHRRKSKVVLSR